MHIISTVPAASDWLDAWNLPSTLIEAPVELDRDALRQVDVVVVADRNELPTVLASLVRAPATVVEFAPRTLKEVLDGVLLLARHVDALRDAMQTLATGELRLRRLHERLGIAKDGSVHGRPPVPVLLLRAGAPLTVPGAWVPDMARLAGGQPLLVAPGGTARPVSTAEIAGAGAKVGFVFGTEMIEEEEVRVLSGRSWHLGDGSLVEHAGPQIYRTIELLAVGIHGEAAGIEVAAGELEPFVAEAAAA